MAEARSIEFLVLILADLLVGVSDLRDRGGVNVFLTGVRDLGRDGMLRSVVYCSSDDDVISLADLLLMDRSFFCQPLLVYDVDSRKVIDCLYISRRRIST